MYIFYNKKAYAKFDKPGTETAKKYLDWAQGACCTACSFIQGPHIRAGWHNGGLMLCRRLRRRPNIKPALARPLVSVGMVGVLRLGLTRPTCTVHV